MSDPFKAWLDAMPVDDVQGRIERLERKLSDLRVIERLYSERHPDADPQTASEAAGDESVSEPDGGEPGGEPTEPVETADAPEPESEHGPSEYGTPPT